MSTATTSMILYQLYNLQRRNRYRFSIPVCNTYRISCNSTAKDGYCDRVRRSIRTEVNAGKDHPPELPAPPPRSSSFIAWAYGAIMTMFIVIIPLLTSGKWGALLALKRKMDSTLERVEEVTEVVEDVAELVDELTDKATEYLPHDSRLKYILDKIDDAAEQTVKAADFAQEILDKIEDVGDTIDAIDELIDKDRTQDKKVVEVEKNLDKVIQKLMKKVQTLEKKIDDIEKKMEKITEQPIEKGHGEDEENK